MTIFCNKYIKLFTHLQLKILRKFMKKIFLLTLILFAYNMTYGQNPRIFKTIKHSYFSEFYVSPSGVFDFHLAEKNDFRFDQDPTIALDYVTNWSMTVTNIIYTYRYNLKEYSNDFSIALSFSPEIGLSPSYLGGVGLINIPGYLTLNFGDGATKKSDLNRGWYFGFGYEYSMIEMIRGRDNISYLNSITTSTGKTYSVMELPNKWGEPIIIIGLRWGGGRFHEISFKYGVNPFYKYQSNDFIPWAQSYQLSIGKSLFL